MLPKCRLFTIRWLLIDRLLQRWLRLPVDVWPIRELLLFLWHLCALLVVSLRQLEFVLLHLLTQANAMYLESQRMSRRDQTEKRTHLAVDGGVGVIAHFAAVGVHLDHLPEAST